MTFFSGEPNVSAKATGRVARCATEGLQRGRKRAICGRRDKPKPSCFIAPAWRGRDQHDWSE